MQEVIQKHTEMALGDVLDLILVVIADSLLLEGEVMAILMNGSILYCWLVQGGQIE